MSGYSLKVSHKVKKRYPIFQTEVRDTYPHSNGGQQLGTLTAAYNTLKSTFYFKYFTKI